MTHEQINFLFENNLPYSESLFIHVNKSFKRYQAILRLAAYKHLTWKDSDIIEETYKRIITPRSDTMSWFYTSVDGEFTKLADMDTACEEFIKNVKYHYEKCKATNDRLKKENVELRDEHYKDKELQKWRDAAHQAQDDLHRGFPISEKEWEAVKTWMEQHDREAHSLDSDDDSTFVKRGGAIGGNYKYEFIPTSIGVIGTVYCSCGASFQFQEI